MSSHDTQNMIELGLIVLYGLSVVNIPIGLIGGAVQFVRSRLAKNENQRKYLVGLSYAWLLSAIPLFGGLVGVAMYTAVICEASKNGL